MQTKSRRRTAKAKAFSLPHRSMYITCTYMLYQHYCEACRTSSPFHSYLQNIVDTCKHLLTIYSFVFTYAASTRCVKHPAMTHENEENSEDAGKTMDHKSPKAPFYDLWRHLINLIYRLKWHQSPRIGRHVFWSPSQHSPLTNNTEACR